MLYGLILQRKSSFFGRPITVILTPEVKSSPSSERQPKSKNKCRENLGRPFIQWGKADYGFENLSLPLSGGIPGLGWVAMRVSPCFAWARVSVSCCRAEKLGSELSEASNGEHTFSESSNGISSSMKQVLEASNLIVCRTCPSFVLSTRAFRGVLLARLTIKFHCPRNKDGSGPTLRCSQADDQRFDAVWQVAENSGSTDSLVRRGEKDATAPMAKLLRLDAKHLRSYLGGNQVLDSAELETSSLPSWHRWFRYNWTPGPSFELPDHLASGRQTQWNEIALFWGLRNPGWPDGNHWKYLVQQ